MNVTSFCVCSMAAGRVLGVTRGYPWTFEIHIAQGRVLSPGGKRKNRFEHYHFLFGDRFFSFSFSA